MKLKLMNCNDCNLKNENLTFFKPCKNINIIFI